MGQQQLLLLVLGMVIVGIAVVAGIQAFSEGKAKADRDAAVSDAMRLISDIQAWKLKPSAFGGGANVAGFTGVSFSAIGISDVDEKGRYKTVNGCYELQEGPTAKLTIYVNNEGECGETIATVTISGTKVSDIQWRYKGQEQSQ